MDTTQMLGLGLVVAAGVLVGTAPWPVKVMREFKYEHWAFVAMLTCMFIVPWVVTLALFPNAPAAYAAVPKAVFLKASLFSASAGLANATALVCFTTIGISLTSGLSSGVAISVGVVTPMIFKASGVFQNAPSPSSTAGTIVLSGAAVMIAGVVLMTRAGLGREQTLTQAGHKTGAFLLWGMLAILAGVMSVGGTFSFAYCQDPIRSAMLTHGAGEMAANSAVWVVGQFVGGLINILYPAYLMTKNRSWGVLLRNPGEVILSVVFGLMGASGFLCMGKGMLLLGALGASVGFGMQLALQIVSMQSVGFIGGEWKGVIGGPRRWMQVAIAVLLIAAIIMAYGNGMAEG